SPGRRLPSTYSRSVAAIRRGSSRSISPRPRPAMYRPHVLVFAPGKGAVELPANEAADVDEGVAVDDDPADRHPRRVELAARHIPGGHRDARDPALARGPFDLASPPRETDPPTITPKKAMSHEVAFRPHVGHGQEAMARAGGAGHIGGLA